MKEGFDDISSSGARGRFQIEPDAAGGEKLGGSGPAIRQTTLDDGVPVTRRAGLINHRAALKKDLH
ncbi:MAG: hypothetical protein JOY62_12910 [Acidobacteriaceae bacterium]|nr:hypothetical protein [Acidobacteriaceae bacterium]MBV9780861.1 hypothetical protein [Acidobacteriaceae bacterium]